MRIDVINRTVHKPPSPVFFFVFEYHHALIVAVTSIAKAQGIAGNLSESCGVINTCFHSLKI